jgi:hypothetical protein
MQTTDFWSFPFAPLDADGGTIGATVRTVLAGVAGTRPDVVPDRWTDDVGGWCSAEWSALLSVDEQLAANRALGLVA